MLWSPLHYTYLYECEIVWHEVVELVRDEDAAYVELDVVGLGSVAVEAVGGLHARDEQQRAERDLALRHEVGPAQAAAGQARNPYNQCSRTSQYTNTYLARGGELSLVRLL